MIEFEIAEAAQVVNLIDVVTKRGAIEGNELLLVGALRERFASAVAEAKKNLPASENSNTPRRDPVVLTEEDTAYVD